jgi:hypothetical protein
MHDLPRGPALLTLARDVLLNDLLPLLPEERRLEALLVANCMAIAAREARANWEQTAVRREIEKLYGTEVPALSPLPFPPPLAGEGQVGGDDAHGGEAEVWRRFACELRNGGFENSPEREAIARAILWRMTIAKLRLANPRFLAANGFARAGRGGREMV